MLPAGTVYGSVQRARLMRWERSAALTVIVPSAASSRSASRTKTPSGTSSVAPAITRPRATTISAPARGEPAEGGLVRGDREGEGAQRAAAGAVAGDRPAVDTEVAEQAVVEDHGDGDHGGLVAGDGGLAEGVGDRVHQGIPTSRKAKLTRRCGEPAAPVSLQERETTRM